ncbi:nucleotidyltransferase family protein [Sphingomonas bacterium]|uniref:nucleotidyltransferase family protein n=1 Tax=Sphingomonas bacterium TaxID=1895847 RepID=UPI0015771959|nr:nucleotidyltransferase domain-containing protein [Sphingomonas bacterium]
MSEIKRLLPILDRWAHGTGTIVYLYGSRARGDYHNDSDVDVFVEWPADLNNRFVDWWTLENANIFKNLSHDLGAKVQILDPCDKEMQVKIRSAKIVGKFGCAMAILLPRLKPVR